MNHKNCMVCSHRSVSVSDAPCNECVKDRWEPDELAQSLIAAGRREGLQEALDIARAHQGESALTLRMKLEEALEVK